MINYAEKAKALFLEGYNCSQAVLLAFSDILDLDESMAAKLSSSFGGGMGRMREVCGAVSGMFMVSGLLLGYDDPKATEEKATHYARIQQLAEKFRTACGSIVCRDLLDNPDASATPTARTAEFYKKRPCAELVALAASLVADQLIAEGILVP